MVSLIRLKVKKMLDTDGTTRSYPAGSIVHLGKQFATALIRTGEAEFVEGERFALLTPSPIAPQGISNTVTSTPRSGQRRVYDIRINERGNLEYEAEEVPAP